MKTLFGIVLLFATLTCIASADDSLHLEPKKKKLQHEVFINTTFFLKQIISLSNNNIEISPYIVGYKLFPGKHHGLRFSVGGNWSSKRQNPDSNFVQIAKTSAVDYRVGYEYRIKVAKAWTFFCGVDMVNRFGGSSNRTNSVTDILTLSSNSWAVGGGPVAGIQVNLHKRISLFTETAFYYRYSQTTSKTTSLNFQDLNVNRLIEVDQNGSFMLPTSIYFVFRF